MRWPTKWGCHMSKRKRIESLGKRPSGGAKLKAAGRHPILLGVSADQLTMLRKAAAKELRPVTQFVIFHALAAALRAAMIPCPPIGPGEDCFEAASSSTKTPRKEPEIFTDLNGKQLIKGVFRNGKAAPHE